ncbi:MAG: DUF3617 family protein [Thermoanaerobaculia bacterium]
MKMTRFAFLAVSALVLLPLSASAADHPNMKPGKWEVTTKMEMEGMPMAMPPVTVTHCYKQEDIENPEKSLPKGSNQGDCKMLDYKLDGNKVTWKVECTGKQKVTGSGEVVYSGDSYEGTMNMEMEQHKMKMNFKAHRLGDCE